MSGGKSIVKAFEVWESSSRTEIDGALLGTLHVPIQYADRDTYNAAQSNAPVIQGWGSYKSKAIFVFDESENGPNKTTLTPSVAFPAYDTIMDPYLWSAVVCLTQDYDRLYERQLLATEPLLFRPSLTMGTYLHLTYAGSRYGYVTGPVSASGTDDNGNGGGIPVFPSGATRIDYLTGATANSGLVGRLFQQLAIRTYKAGSWITATTLAGITGNLYDFFIDESANLLGSGYINVYIWDYADGRRYYGVEAVNWGSATYANIATDLNAQWLLGGPEVSQYHYLLGDTLGNLYTYPDDTAVPISGALTADLFLKYGPTEPPTADCIRTAEAQITRVYKWTGFYHTALPLSAVVRGIPLNNTITGTADLSNAAALTKAWAHAFGEVHIQYSFDGGATWTEQIQIQEFLARKPEAMFPEMQEFGPVTIQLSLWRDGTTVTDFGLEWNVWNDNAFDWESFLMGVMMGQKIKLMDSRRR